MNRGEAFESICAGLLSELKENKISRAEAQLKWFALVDEYNELGEEEFNLKYIDKCLKEGSK